MRARTARRATRLFQMIWLGSAVLATAVLSAAGPPQKAGPKKPPALRFEISFPAASS